MFTSVEDHVFPDLVADRDSLELLTEPCQQLEILAGINHRGRIKRIVKDNGFGFRGENSSQGFLSQPPMRRFETHQARYPSGLANDGKIGVVYRLENDDLIAGLDDPKDRTRQRFGAA